MVSGRVWRAIHQLYNGFNGKFTFSRSLVLGRECFWKLETVSTWCWRLYWSFCAESFWQQESSPVITLRRQWGQKLVGDLQCWTALFWKRAYGVRKALSATNKRSVQTVLLRRKKTKRGGRPWFTGFYKMRVSIAVFSFICAFLDVLSASYRAAAPPDHFGKKVRSRWFHAWWYSDFGTAVRLNFQKATRNFCKFHFLYYTFYSISVWIFVISS